MVHVEVASTFIITLRTNHVGVLFGVASLQRSRRHFVNIALCVMHASG